MIQNLVRENIRNLKAYTAARHEKLSGIFLDANENPFADERNLNRYPDPFATSLRQKISAKNGVNADQVIVTSGSDEALDLVYKIFCNAGDAVLALTPTYGMYKVLADIYDCEFKDIRVSDSILRSPNATRLPLLEIEKALENVNVIFLCNPNNPLGQVIEKSDMEALCCLGKIVLVDEAYIEFSMENSAIDLLEKYPNLIITRTFSKAYGAAAIRCGYLLTSAEIAAYLLAVKAPYNMNSLTISAAETLIEKDISDFVNYVKNARKMLSTKLAEMPFVSMVYSSEANFVLFETENAAALYKFCLERGIILRRRSDFQNALRVSIGTPDEMEKLYTALNDYKKQLADVC